MTLTFEDMEYLKQAFPKIYEELIFRVDAQYRKAIKQKTNSVKDSRKNKFLGSIRIVQSMRSKNFKLNKVLNKYQVMKNYVELNRIQEDAKDDLSSFKR